MVLDLSGLTFIADYFVICSCGSTTQVRAVADFVEESLRIKGARPIGIEGFDHGHWVLLDYGDVVVHVFEKETRDFYAIDKLWMDAEVVDIDENSPDLAGQDKRSVHT